MRVLKLSLLFGLVLSFLQLELNAQNPPNNQGSHIYGPEESCAEQTGYYTFEHPDNCDCEEVSWTVTNGRFDPVGSGAADFNNNNVKVIWDKGKSNGKLEVKAIKCFKEFNDDGSPHYDINLKEDSEFLIHLFDSDMINLELINEGSLDCESKVITIKLKSLNSHLEPSHLRNFTWTIPSNWQTQANARINGEDYGERFPNVKLDTDEPLLGNYTISVTYTSPNFCPPKTFTRSVLLSIGDCRPNIPYSSPPNYFQSHSAVVTDFTFDRSQIINPGKDYHFASGGTLNINKNFEVRADNSTSFDAFIADCGCGSPWHDPSLMGGTTVQYLGNYGKFKTAATNRADSSANIKHSSALKVKSFKVYPNPSHGLISIQSSLDS
ncbi:MAG: hypothetical protein ACPGVV_12560, partial [Croceimicrobium sp.]